MKILFLFILMTAVIIPQNKKQSLLLPAFFSDNMVLQQKSAVNFWGKGNPGSEVTVNTGWGGTAKTTVNPDSSWKLSIKTVKAGGPYVVNILSDSTYIVYKNVMLGEVWLCSGQSNMEEPLQGWPPQNPIKNSAEEIKNANYPDIRLFTVARAVSTTPEFNCTGSWSECSPHTAATFSAVAYFFGRKLYKELDVPIGLIVSSWGGTKIQPWISARYLDSLSAYKQVIDKFPEAEKEITRQKDWIFKHRVIDVSGKSPENQWKNLDFGDGNCAKPDFDDSKWHTMKLPTYWESTEVGTFDGAVWFRKKIDIPQSWVKKDLVLELGPVDDMDMSYVNGTLVGAVQEAGFYDKPRIYNVPADIVKGTVLTIAVRVLDIMGGGGIWGNNVKMRIHPKGSDDNIALSGEWKYLPVAELLDGKFYVYNIKDMEFYSRPKTTMDLGPNTPTMLYNGMIAPLIPYSIKGTIWYQGESNSDEPQDYNNYHMLFSMMINNWRADWGEGNFPFYFVQIAPWSYGDNSKSYVVRNAQFETLSVPNTGIAVTLDIASLATIHPPDKQDTGKRLALWALAKDYNKDVFYSGPLYKSMEIKGGRIILSFEHAGKGLVMKDINGKTNFIIAGPDQKFVDAQAEVDGDKLIVYSSEVKDPVAVRYTWGNKEEATLFNKEGLPSPTFKTDNWSDK